MQTTQNNIKKVAWESIPTNPMLSTAAKGLLWELLARRELHKNIRVSSVCAATGMGEAKCRSLLREMVCAGYLGEQERYITEGGQIRYTPFTLLVTVSRFPRDGERDVTDSKNAFKKTDVAAVKSQELNCDESAVGEAPQDALTQNHNDGNGSEPLTHTLPPTSAEPPSPATAKLLAFGVHEEMARTLADQHSEAQIDAAIAEARRSADRNPPGFVVDALRGGWLTSKPHPPTPLSDFREGDNLTPDPSTLAGRSDEEETSPDGIPAPEQTTEVDLRAEETQTSPCAAEQDDYWRLCQDPPTGEWATPTGQWYAAYSQLRLTLDRPTFEGVLKGARLLEVVAKTWRIEVRTAYAQQLLQGRLYRGIRRVVRDIHGDLVELEFIERGSAAAAT